MTDNRPRPWWHILLEGGVQYLTLRAAVPGDDGTPGAVWYRTARCLRAVAAFFGRLAIWAEAHYWRVVTP